MSYFQGNLFLLWVAQLVLELHIFWVEVGVVARILVGVVHKREVGHRT